MLYEKFKSWSTGWLGQPHIQIRLFMVPLLEVKEIITRSLVTQFIDLLFHVLSLDFGVLFGMWYQIAKIVEQLPELALQTSLSNQEDSLSVLPLLGMRFCIFECSQFILRIYLLSLFAFFALFQFKWLLLFAWVISWVIFWNFWGFGLLLLLLRLLSFGCLLDGFLRAVFLP